MKFIVDAQLPRRLAHLINNAGYDAVHTLDLPDQNNTTDSQIIAVSETEQRIVVTKDADFVNNFLLKGQPHKLLLISTGNITNAELDALFLPQLGTVIESFKTSRFVELNRNALIIHV